jgi:hypothetical protein
MLSWQQDSDGLQVPIEFCSQTPEKYNGKKYDNKIPCNPISTRHALTEWRSLHGVTGSPLHRHYWNHTSVIRKQCCYKRHPLHELQTCSLPSEAGRLLERQSDVWHLVSWLTISFTKSHLRSMRKVHKSFHCYSQDRLCGLVAGATRSSEVVGLERGPLSLVSTTEELTELYV